MTARGGITATRIGRAPSSANQATAPQSPAPAQAAPTKRTAASTANQLAPAPASSSMAKPLARKSKCSDVSGTNGPRAPCPDDEISRPITSVGKTSWGERRGRKGISPAWFRFWTPRLESNAERRRFWRGQAECECASRSSPRTTLFDCCEVKSLFALCQDIRCSVQRRFYDRAVAVVQPAEIPCPHRRDNRFLYRFPLIYVFSLNSFLSNDEPFHQLTTEHSMCFGIRKPTDPVIWWCG